MSCSSREELSYDKIEPIHSKIILKNLSFFPEKVLQNSSYYELNNVVKKLINYPQIKIEIQGHYFSRESYDDLRCLNVSEQRAIAVKNYFAGKGVDSQRMGIKAFGNTKPIVPKGTLRYWEENTRIEIVPVN